MAWTDITAPAVAAGKPITTNIGEAIRGNLYWNKAKVQSIVGAGTLGADDNNMLTLLDATAGAFSYNLPAAPATGMVAGFEKKDATANAATVAGNGKLIDGVSSVIFGGQGERAFYEFDGVGWRTIAARSPWTVLAEGSAAAVGTLDITFTASQWRQVRIILSDCRPASDGVNLFMRTSTDGGSTFDAGASDYAYAGVEIAHTPTSTPFGSGAGAELNFENLQGNVAAERLSGVVDIIDPSDPTRTFVAYQAACHTSAGIFITTFAWGQRRSDADVDGIRFQYSAGNIANVHYKVLGLEK